MSKITFSCRSLRTGLIVLCCRLVLGSVFLYSGVIKLLDPIGFADSLETFKLLPTMLNSLVVMGLPVLEVLLGMLMVMGVWTATASFGVIAMLAVFMLAIAQGLARGLSLDCGCFGSSAPSVASGWFALGRDMLLLVPAVVTYRRELS